MLKEERERLERIKENLASNSYGLGHIDSCWVVALASARDYAFTQAVKQLEEAEAMNDGLAAEIDRLRDALAYFAETSHWLVGGGVITWGGDRKPWGLASRALNPPKTVYVFKVKGDGAEMKCKFNERKDADAFAAWLGEHAGWPWTQSEVEE